MRARVLGYSNRRVAQTPRTFRNWPALLGSGPARILDVGAHVAGNRLDDRIRVHEARAGSAGEAWAQLREWFAAAGLRVVREQTDPLAPGLGLAWLERVPT